ncbi:uncharacterized protein LOC126700895 [Quercus robur]|uniref:uncharacterized protein LOC126700895 n=1 Tax=Quercus robur TaxID=38942 RepID=UPI002161FCFC|nr:uncharacterized protein LOC126700895 [Quercus robur]
MELDVRLCHNGSNNPLRWSSVWRLLQRLRCQSQYREFMIIECGCLLSLVSYRVYQNITTGEQVTLEDCCSISLKFLQVEFPDLCLFLQVFPYGSVPLKTYLPDGDIDLTTLSCPSVEDAWVSDVHAVLREEEHNEAARFEVKDIHCIDAEVKLVKCIVQNIVVDISFNQLGGLCTLCFLEQVDRLVGKDHLFKRSIILIKAWCYYESRILGAHHGLLSTYALEKLVLYIFHQFHSSLNAPLARTRKILTEKIAQLNSAIDDVFAQLHGDDAPNGAAVNSDEVGASM